jgi:hypothetical protein
MQRILNRLTESTIATVFDCARRYVQILAGQVGLLTIYYDIPQFVAHRNFVGTVSHSAIPFNLEGSEVKRIHR